ncbi:anthranilate synthase component I family protein [Pseudobythopirellula maris]|nr:anthranilate synthase component I family protein [Pseudobythopirellula maris]
MSHAVAQELDSALQPCDVLRAFGSLPGLVFFDSAAQGETARYSFVAADPYEWSTLGAADADRHGARWLAALERRLAEQRCETIAGLPPWQGGAAGLLGYDLGRAFERIPKARWNEFQTPAAAVGQYDVVLAFDHQRQRAWIISQGAPEKTPGARRRRARRRLEQFLGLLKRGPQATAAHAAPRELHVEQLAPCYETPADGVLSNFSRDGYLAAVRRAVDHIHAGDVFQVNLSQRLLKRAPSESPVDVYLSLRERNPAPMAGYLDGGDWQLMSASPERFVRVGERQVEARPIKGTRPRGSNDAADERLANELRSSEKDRAENVMIVDLMRNDLSRVCTDESVEVPVLWGVERFAHVQHLVSVVTGELRAGQGALDLVRAAFPGGSVTGAPKIRSCELIAELEPTARGAYCGSLFYHGFDGAMDSSILIRTVTRTKGWLQAPVGGGVVADSDPQAEYEETWHKASGLF